MSISQQFVPARFTANGTQRQWSFEFSLPQGAVVVGYLTSPQGEVSKITENMSVDLLNHTYTYPTEASGLAPLAQGWKITLIRQTPCTQEIQLTEQDALPYVSLEEGLDKLTYLMQETQETLGRTIQFPCTQTNLQTDAEAYIQTIQTIANQASSSATAAQNSAGVAAQYAQSAQQDYTTLAADLASLQTTVRDNQIADQTYANSVASHALTVAEAYCDSKLASEETARTAADNLKQDKLTVAQQNAVDSGVTASVVAQVQTNQENITALDAELDENRPWQKPSGWVDIRSGALPNSIYFLVGHAADFTKYPTFEVRATVSSGTYDVFVDGVKQATTASETYTELDWQTLNLASGFDVTYPEALKTHIVRITPTSPAATLTAIRLQLEKQFGALWMHVNVNNAINLTRSFDNNCTTLEAVTSQGGTLQVTSLYAAFQGCSSLKEVPVLDCNGQDMSPNSTFANCQNLNKISFKNFYADSQQYRRFIGCAKLKKIDCINSFFTPTPNEFRGCSSLEKLPPFGPFAGNVSSISVETLFMGSTNVKDTILDFSIYPQLSKLTLGGASDSRLDWVKGLIVSAEALFAGTSPQLDVSYTGLNRGALVNLFNSLPTVENSQVCNVTGATGAADLTADDLAIATNKGWTVTR